MSCSAPLVGERNEIVSSARAMMTSTARTIRRTMVFRPREKRPGPRERRTDEPSTATRAVRSRDATGLGYRGSRPGSGGIRRHVVRVDPMSGTRTATVLAAIGAALAWTAVAGSAPGDPKKALTEADQALAASAVLPKSDLPTGRWTG